VWPKFPTFRAENIPVKCNCRMTQPEPAQYLLPPNLLSCSGQVPVLAQAERRGRSALLAGGWSDHCLALAIAVAFNCGAAPVERARSSPASTATTPPEEASPARRALAGRPRSGRWPSRSPGGRPWCAAQSRSCAWKGCCVICCCTTISWEAGFALTANNAVGCGLGRA
jgi:hypothetical protein